MDSTHESTPLFTSHSLGTLVEGGRRGEELGESNERETPGDEVPQEGGSPPKKKMKDAAGGSIVRHNNIEAPEPYEKRRKEQGKKGWDDTASSLQEQGILRLDSAGQHIHCLVCLTKDGQPTYVKMDGNGFGIGKLRRHVDGSEHKKAVAEAKNKNLISDYFAASAGGVQKPVKSAIRAHSSESRLICKGVIVDDSSASYSNE